MIVFFFFSACDSSTSDTAESPEDSCLYDKYLGTCIYEGNGLSTFIGNINGSDVSFQGNTFSFSPNEEEPEIGSEISCTISYITKGTCTPCLLDIGDCGSEAFHSMP